MSPRRLGYAVLVYAALTTGTVLELVRVTLGEWDGGWWVLVDTALWLAFVSGGFGLIFGRGWSRFVLLVAAADSVVQSIVGMFIEGTLGLTELGKSLEAVLFAVLF